MVLSERDGQARPYKLTASGVVGAAFLGILGLYPESNSDFNTNALAQTLRALWTQILRTVSVIKNRSSNNFSINPLAIALMVYIYVRNVIVLENNFTLILNTDG